MFINPIFFLKDSLKVKLHDDYTFSPGVPGGNSENSWSLLKNLKRVENSRFCDFGLFHTQNQLFLFSVRIRLHTALYESSQSPWCNWKTRYARWYWHSYSHATAFHGYLCSRRLLYRYSSCSFWRNYNDFGFHSWWQRYVPYCQL